MERLFVPANQNIICRERADAISELRALYRQYPWILPKTHSIGGIINNGTQNIRNMIWFFKFEISFHEKSLSELEIIK